MKYDKWLLKFQQLFLKKFELIDKSNLSNKKQKDKIIQILNNTPRNSN